MTRILIGAGNLFAGDDAAGCLVARSVRSLRPQLPDVRVLESSGDGLVLLDCWTSEDEVILVDAAVTGVAPGAIHRLDAVAAPLPETLRLASSHLFGVAKGIELARALGRLPRRLTVYAVEGARFDTAAEVTPEVARAIERVAASVAEEWG
jgi:hydrogenase maturation protease